MDGFTFGTPERCGLTTSRQAGSPSRASGKHRRRPLGKQFDGCGRINKHQTFGQAMVHNAIKVPLDIVFIWKLTEPIHPDYRGQILVHTSIEYGVQPLTEVLNINDWVQRYRI